MIKFKLIRLTVLFSLGFLIISNNVFAQSQDLKYIFIGHCYQPNTAGDKVDYRLENFDFTDYEGIWLGGDVCSEALINYGTVQYIDSIFDLGNPETHWAMGNHDARNGNWEYISDFSYRNTYYAFTSNKLTRIIINTNLVPTDCESMDEQYNIIMNVCDTIQESKYLVLLMHHGLWDSVPGLPSTYDYAQSHLVYWNSNCYDVNSNFVHSIYPKLIEVEQRGVEVVCVMGDIGDRTNKFDVISDDGIQFLGSGLYHNEPDNNVLVFDYDLSDYKLSWDFLNLDSLLLEQQKLVND
ncbi:MAG: hypothetical protein C0598_09745 [Marinilabiliales bacterium]|nr:MAG: hypothetical protein C0598_09745 [Marinilabiliales bacterium]